LLRHIIRYYLEKSRDEALLIPGNDEGEPMDRKTIHNLITKLGKAAVIENIYALRFRATFAKYYEEVCMFEENVMQSMGLLNKRHLRLYIDEMEYKDPHPEKRFSIMDKWNF
jgi:hypothetical protein